MISDNVHTYHNDRTALVESKRSIWITDRRNVGKTTVAHYWVRRTIHETPDPLDLYYFGPNLDISKRFIRDVSLHAGRSIPLAFDSSNLRGLISSKNVAIVIDDIPYINDGLSNELLTMMVSRVVPFFVTGNRYMLKSMMETFPSLILNADRMLIN